MPQQLNKNDAVVFVAIERERERCATIVDNLARILGSKYVDPNPEYNRTERIQEMHKTLAEVAAETIRNPI